MVGGKTLSMTSTSFPNRLITLPDGVVSKNPTGNRRMPNNNSEWSSLLLRRHPMAILICEIHTKIAEIHFNYTDHFLLKLQLSQLHIIFLLNYQKQILNQSKKYFWEIFEYFPQVVELIFFKSATLIFKCKKINKKGAATCCQFNTFNQVCRRVCIFNYVMKIHNIMPKY